MPIHPFTALLIRPSLALIEKDAAPALAANHPQGVQVMPSNVPIQGECDPRFARVRQVFADNFEQRGEVGAAVAVTLDGRPIIDL